MATATQRRRKAARRRAHALRLDRPDYRLRHSIFDEWPLIAEHLDHLVGDMYRAMIEVGRWVGPLFDVHPALAKAASDREHDKALEDLRRSYQIGDPSSFVKITDVGA